MQRPFHFRPDDWVIYEKPKSGSHPGPRAKDIHPSTSGETYDYFVDKFWRVEKVDGDRQIVARTRTGKPHLIATDDPCLRPARWWEILLYRQRFIQEAANVQPGSMRQV